MTGSKPGAVQRETSPPMQSPDTPGTQTNQSPQYTLTGTVERIIYSNPDSAYVVVSLRPEKSKDEITVVGNLLGVQPQEILTVRGQYAHDKRYGRQFKVESYESVLPAESAAIEKFLGSGLIKGIGKVYAKRLVEHFGADIFSIIDETPSRLHEVPHIGAKRAEQICRGWAEHRAIRGIILFLQRYGIAQGFAPRIYKEYGEKAVEQLQRNPYQLALDVRGIGFKSADSIAQKMGIPTESIERCKAGVYFLLQDFAGDGHTFFPADPLIEKAIEALGVPQELVIEAINVLKAENHIVLEVLPDDTRAVYLKRLHGHECGVAELLVRLLNTGKLLPKIDSEKELSEFEAQFQFKLASNQRIAVQRALEGGVLVITGGPGTGKTTIIKAILRILRKYGVTTLLAAPTGRAAKRMHEMTHQHAATIHRLLQYSPQEGKYLRNPQNPLKCDYLIVDEASMIDISLAHVLLRALNATSSIIFVGDIDQLPSVGPGNFLRDVINSGTVPVVQLNEIFRQAQQSMIVTNAHRINSGQIPVMEGPDAGGHRDFFFFDCPEPESALATIKQLVQSRIPSKFGFKPMEDIQVLSPMHRGVIGTQNLNRELQGLLNPGGTALDRGGVVFRVGDKVMQTSNDYDKDVFNGDIGVIEDIDRADHVLKVNFDGRVVPYEFTELDELELAYAISIHKSQGSEYRAVVVPISTHHYVMLQRNLLYTAITRGRKLVCLVGQRRAVEMAVRNVVAAPRHSGLDQRLAAVRRAIPSPRPL